MSNQPPPHEREQMLPIAQTFDMAGRDARNRAFGRPRLIAVKTTNGWKRTPFHLTRNEGAVGWGRRSECCLFRLWNFARAPKGA